jgi:DNA repair exonuclease SbcCD ATPase subunit
MPLHFENRNLRMAVLLIILLIFGLQIWFQFLNREAFSALAAANLLLVQKVEKFDADVAWADVDQTLNNAIVISSQARQFDIDTKNRKANMDSWAASSAKTRDEVIQIHAALENFAAETREQRALQAQRLEELSQQILQAVATTNRNTAVTRRHADAAAHKLSQKIVTAPDVEALKQRADQLQQQNKELKKQKAVFKLLPW